MLQRVTQILSARLIYTYFRYICFRYAFHTFRPTPYGSLHMLIAFLSLLLPFLKPASLHKFLVFASLSGLIVVSRRFHLRLFTVNSPIRYVLMSVVHFHCFSVTYSMSSLVVFFYIFYFIFVFTRTVLVRNCLPSGCVSHGEIF